MGILARRGPLLAGVLGVCAASAASDVWFTHDQNVIALPPPPVNGVFAAPDVADIFFSPVFIRSAPGVNQGNALVVNNPAQLGLLPGDNVDAVHHELRELGLSYDEFPAYVFSVNAGDRGLAGTAVRGQVPDNAADLYESNGFGYNVTDVNENQIGLAPGVRVDVDGFFLTPAGVVDPARWVYFSLTPGSPTLAAIGASAGDVLAAQLGGSPVVCISGSVLGLADGDDLDGLIMFEGVDANGDGDFDDAGDNFPYVVFSVSPGSSGLAGTGVSAEAALDPPVGGDIYSSIGYGQNALIMDDGQYGLGLEDDDDVDGLDLPSMAVPADHPLGTPFTGGFTTPGGPGTPGGPVIPPPGGTGGPIGCTPMASIRFGLCVQSLSSQTCDIEVRVFISCNTPGLPSTLSTGKITVPCDTGDGKGVRKAVQMLTDALRGLKIPGPPGSSPDAGKPVFAPGAGGGAGIGSFPPGGPPTHVNSQLDVNGALVDCKVTGFATVLCGCDCYTQNVRVAAWSVEAKSLVDWDEPGVLTIGLYEEEIPAGVYMMQFAQGDEPCYVETPAGTALEVSQFLADYFTDKGYVVKVADDGQGIVFHEGPDGLPVSEVWGCGFVFGGTGYHELCFEGLAVDAECPCDLDHDGVVDISDVLMFIDMMNDSDERDRLDFDHSGQVNYFDLRELVNNMGGC